MSNPDIVRVRHMLDAAQEALSFVSDKSRVDLDVNRMLALSLVKSIEIVGEAASNVSPVFRKAHPEIPWTVIVTMRNRLIHAYFDVDLDRIWDTITDDLPPLIHELKMILSLEDGRKKKQDDMDEK
jgi:uncharacterized protein with HEPN domain